MELRGARVRIRPWQRSDFNALDSWPPYHDPLDQVWNIPRQNSGDNWYDSYQASIVRRAWAVDSMQGEMIGRISLREIDERLRRARLGVSFGAPYVGKGLGTEALRLFLDYYFGALGQRIMVLDVAAPNLRAVRCYERLGFQFVGQEWRDAGRYLDLAFLNEPRYFDLRPYFRHSRGNTWVQFHEMELYQAQWEAMRRQQERSTSV